MSSKGSETEVAKVVDVSDTSAAEEAKVLDPVDSDPEPAIPPRAFPFQARMTELSMRMENVEGYVWEHDPYIQWLISQVTDLRTEVVKLRAEMLQSAGYAALTREIKRNRDTINTHLRAPHPRTGN